jgi:hypothetical protein
MVSALIASMMIDSVLTVASLYVVAKMHIADGQRKKCDRDRNPNKIAHNISL